MDVEHNDEYLGCRLSEKISTFVHCTPALWQIESLKYEKKRNRQYRYDGNTP